VYLERTWPLGDDDLVGQFQGKRQRIEPGAEVGRRCRRDDAE
jgi:hypothetical protein